MKIMARETNYGTRIDYILVTPGLLPWIKHGDIQPSLKGSDHCPTYVDLHDSIVDGNGQTRLLREEMKCVKDERRAPPRLASKNWDEYSGKQKLLSSFFGKGGPKATDAAASSKSVDLSLLATTKTSSQSGVGAPSEPTTLDAAVQSKSESAAPSQRAPAPTAVSISASETDATTATSSSITSSQSSSSAKTPLKRKSQALSNSGGSDAYDAVIPKKSKGKAATPAKDKEKAAQKSIATFFGKPPPIKSGGQPTPKEIVVVDDSDGDNHQDLDADFQLALKLSQEEASGLPASQNTLASSRAVDPAETKAAWSSMFAKVEPPRCTVHDEPAKEFTVNKTGPNKGKTFFVCARLVLPYGSSASLTPSLQTSRSRLRQGTHRETQIRSRSSLQVRLLHVD
jgi:AP endonuclease-2